MRPIFYAPEVYPRYVGSARGNISAYSSRISSQTAFEPIGYIPEVMHTYAYHEETYGALNEMQVGIGESTCSGVFGTKAAGHGGQALLSVDTLTQIAMERSSSARQAVSLMGALAEKHGFYGAGSFEGSAESLMVTDPREGFIFHVLPDPTGTSAIWVSDQLRLLPTVWPPFRSGAPSIPEYCRCAHRSASAIATPRCHSPFTSVLCSAPLAGRDACARRSRWGRRQCLRHPWPQYVGSHA